MGKPNVGKATLMNQLVGEKLSIITSKAQTTRHRIMGIVNDDDFQIVYSDTPGMLDPKYKLQEGMMKFVGTAWLDADVLLLVVEVGDKIENYDQILPRIEKSDARVFVILNKVDLSQQEEVLEKLEAWSKRLPNASVVALSALHKFNIENLMEKIVESLPEGPPYFSKDELTDKPMRFFVSEMIREKILLHYKQEIPYSVEVVVEEYKDEAKLIRIRANIVVSRDSQKVIIIGKGGQAIKRVGTDARMDIQDFVGKKVFLELFVKVDKNWRNDETKLRKYGYLD